VESTQNWPSKIKGYWQDKQEMVPELSIMQVLQKIEHTSQVEFAR